MSVSRKFIVAVKMSDVPAYRLAHMAGIDPNVLSKITRGIIMVKPGDDRVLKVGAVLGLSPEECFEGKTEAD